MLYSLIKMLDLHSKPQVVTLCSFWSEEVKAFCNIVSHHVYIITCAIEAAIKSKINLVSSYNYFDPHLIEFAYKPTFIQEHFILYMQVLHVTITIMSAKIIDVLYHLYLRILYPMCNQKLSHY